MEITGVIKWIFIVFVIGTSCIVMITGALHVLSWAWEMFMNKVLQNFKATIKLIEYAYYRKEFKQWLKENKPNKNER